MERHLRLQTSQPWHCAQYVPLSALGVIDGGPCPPYRPKANHTAGGFAIILSTMDSITQGLLGGVTAQLGFRQRLGPAATWIAAGAAMLPDADVFVVPALAAMGVDVGPFDELRYHRGISHSLLAVPLLALAVAGPWWLVRRRQFGWKYLCCLVAVLSHPLLDWCTSYGTQLWAPLTSARYALDAVPIVDIFYTPMLMLTLLAAWITRRLKRLRAATAIGWAGLLLSTAYLGAGRLAHNEAVDRAQAAYARQGGLVEFARAEAYPALGSILVWRVTLETPDAWYAGRTHVLFDRPVELHRHRTDGGPYVRAALADTDAATFRWFANDQLRPVLHRRGGRAIVDLHDMRYSLDPEAGESLWLARVEFDHHGQVQSVRHLHGGHRDNWSIRQLARRAWLGMFEP